MTAMDIPRYQPGDPSRPAIEKGPSDDQLRNLLSALISSSQDLNVRVWLDGVYTDIEKCRSGGGRVEGPGSLFQGGGKSGRRKDPLGAARRAGRLPMANG